MTPEETGGMAIKETSRQLQKERDSLRTKLSTAHARIAELEKVANEAEGMKDVVYGQLLNCRDERDDAQRMLDAVFEWCTVSYRKGGAIASSIRHFPKVGIDQRATIEFELRKRFKASQPTTRKEGDEICRDQEAGILTHSIASSNPSGETVPTSSPEGTPETDAAILVHLEYGDWGAPDKREHVTPNFARKLERERNEARAERDALAAKLAEAQFSCEVAWLAAEKAGARRVESEINATRKEQP